MNRRLFFVILSAIVLSSALFVAAPSVQADPNPSSADSSEKNLPQWLWGDAQLLVVDNGGYRKATSEETQRIMASRKFAAFAATREDALKCGIARIGTELELQFAHDHAYPDNIMDVGRRARADLAGAGVNCVLPGGSAWLYQAKNPTDFRGRTQAPFGFQGFDLAFWDWESPLGSDRVCFYNQTSHAVECKNGTWGPFPPQYLPEITAKRFGLEKIIKPTEVPVEPATMLAKLLAAVKDPDPNVRAKALLQLNQQFNKGPDAANPTLEIIAAALDDPDSKVKIAAIASVGERCSVPGAEKLIALAANSSDSVVKSAAANAFHRLEDCPLSIFETLIKGPAVVQKFALAQMPHFDLRSGEADAGIAVAIESADPEVRNLALEALRSRNRGQAPRELAASPEFLRALQSGDLNIRTQAWSVVERDMGRQEPFVTIFLAQLNSDAGGSLTAEQLQAVYGAVSTLNKQISPAALSRVVRAADDPDPQNRGFDARVVASLAKQKACPYYEQLLPVVEKFSRDTSSDVRNSSAYTLRFFPLQYRDQSTQILSTLAQDREITVRTTAQSALEFVNRSR